MKITAVQQVNSEAAVLHSRYRKFGGNILENVLLLAAALKIHVNSKGFLNGQGHGIRMG
jgi:hypothetical protein